METIWHIGIAVPDLEQGKKELGDVFGLTRRTGVRFVLTSVSDSSRPDDFADWYDTYAAALTVPGYLANAFRFENPDATAGQDRPRFATIYDIVTSDPATAWPDTEHSAGYPTRLFSDQRAKLVAPVLRASYALVGTQTRPGGHGPLTASTSSCPTAATTPGVTSRKPGFCGPGCSTPPHDSGSSKAPLSPPDGSRYSRPMPATPSARTRERQVARRPPQRSRRS